MGTDRKLSNFHNILYAITTGVTIIGFTFFCKVVGYSLIIPFFVFILGVHIYFINKASPKLFIQLALLLTLIIFCAQMISSYSTLPYFYVPVAAIGMLTVLLFNSLYLSVIMTLSSSVIVSLVGGGDLGMMLTFFLGSLVGVYTVREARNRGRLIGAGLSISLVQMVCVFLLNPNLDVMAHKEFTEMTLYPLVANGFISAFVVLALLPLFESLFGVLTNFSLLELTDRNQPLLKRMALEAPGTWQHSLMVSQLAEAAADEVDAHALLARTGAFYHDIGKLIKSDYFTENQVYIGNKHDVIEPSLSRLILLNHVKEGIELAKKYKLNQRIIDFIPQHHGTSLMHYFYQRALEEAKEGEIVNEADYRYPGPKPQTKEAAITLLADSVEGATRALDEPTPGRIEETVKKIINNKFIDGQLDECQLTLQEINTISNIFAKILSAMYHGRVKYPEKSNESHNSRSTEKAAAEHKSSHHGGENNPAR